VLNSWNKPPHQQQVRSHLLRRFGDGGDDPCLALVLGPELNVLWVHPRRRGHQLALVLDVLWRFQHGRVVVDDCEVAGGRGWSFLQIA
jgi:hypothetical protein